MKKAFHIKDKTVLHNYKERLAAQAFPIYIDGIGYLPYDKKHIVTLGVRRIANLVCCAVLLYFFLQKIFLFPLTVLAFFVGANVQINYYTGLVITTAFDRTLIMSFCNISALLVSTLLIYFVYAKSYKPCGIFKKPHRSVTSLAVFMVLSVYIFSGVLGFLLKYLTDTIGFVFPFGIEKITEITPIVIVQLVSLLAFSVLREIFLRGIILTPLRRFGDGFAIIACSLVASLFSGGLLEVVPSFLVSLALCYFVIRSGSVWTAVVCRLCCVSVLFTFEISVGMLEESLGIVVVLLITILAILLAAFSFVTFIKADRNAFRLFPPSDKIKTTYKLSTFACTIGFLICCGYLLIKIVGVVQIIG